MRSILILLAISTVLTSADNVSENETTRKEKRDTSPFKQVQVNTVTKHVPYDVPQPVPQIVIKKVPYDVPKPYPVAVPRPYKVQVPIKVPVTIEKPYPLTVEKPYPVHVPVNVPVNIPKPYPVHIEKPYPVHVPIKVPEALKVPVFVPKPVYLKKGQFDNTGFSDLNGEHDLSDSKFDYDNVQFDAAKLTPIKGKGKLNFKHGSIHAPTFEDILGAGGYITQDDNYEKYENYKELLNQHSSNYVSANAKAHGAGNLKDYGVTENTDQFGHVDLTGALNLNFKIPGEHNIHSSIHGKLNNYDSSNLKLLGNFNNYNFQNNHNNNHHGGGGDDDDDDDDDDEEEQQFTFKNIQNYVNKESLTDGSAVLFPGEPQGNVGGGHGGQFQGHSIHGGHNIHSIHGAQLQGTSLKNQGSHFKGHLGQFKGLGNNLKVVYGSHLKGQRSHLKSQVNHFKGQGGISYQAHGSSFQGHGGVFQGHGGIFQGHGGLKQVYRDQGHYGNVANTQTLQGGTYYDKRSPPGRITVAKYVKNAFTTTNKDVSTPIHLPSGGRGFSHDGRNRIKYFKRAVKLPYRPQKQQQRFVTKNQQKLVSQNQGSTTNKFL